MYVPQNYEIPGYPNIPGQNNYLQQKPNSYCPTCGKAEGLQISNLPGYFGDPPIGGTSLEQWNVAAKDIKISRLESDISKLEEENKNLKAEIEDLKSKIPLKPYPEWICLECLATAATSKIYTGAFSIKIRWGSCDTCDINNRHLTDPKDFGSPEFKGHVKP